jgi:hypothetical protein
MKKNYTPCYSFVLFSATIKKDVYTYYIFTVSIISFQTQLQRKSWLFWLRSKCAMVIFGLDLNVQWSFCFHDTGFTLCLTALRILHSFLPSANSPFFHPLCNFPILPLKNFINQKYMNYVSHTQLSCIHSCRAVENNLRK